MADTPVSQVVIRPATLDDAVLLRRVQAKSWLATYPSEENGVPYAWVKERTDNWFIPESLQETEEHFRKVITDPHQFYRLAEANGEIVGFVHLIEKSDTVELEAIYTRPDTFGSGIGARLMEVALDYIGSRPSELTVASYNQRAIRFYEKHGFSKVEGSEAMYADKMPTIRMIRKGEKS